MSSNPGHRPPAPRDQARGADGDTGFKVTLKSGGQFLSVPCCWDCRFQEGAAAHAGLPPALTTGLYPEPQAPEEKWDGEGEMDEAVVSRTCRRQAEKQSWQRRARREAGQL